MIASSASEQRKQRQMRALAPLLGLRCTAGAIGPWCNIPANQIAAGLPLAVSPEIQPWFLTSPLP